MKVTTHIKKILGINNDIQNIRYSKDNLKKHLIKRNHIDVLKYLDKIDDIINNPDYIGVHPNEKKGSIEYVKVFDDNVLIALKINDSQDCYYIPSMYTITDYKLQSRLFSGRLKKIDKKYNNQ